MEAQCIGFSKSRWKGSKKNMYASLVVEAYSRGEWMAGQLWKTQPGKVKESPKYH
jgi:hypothetical protein